MTDEDWNVVFNMALFQAGYTKEDEETRDLYIHIVKYMPVEILNYVLTSGDRNWNVDWYDVVQNELVERLLEIK